MDRPFLSAKKNVPAGNRYFIQISGATEKKPLYLSYAYALSGTRTKAEERVK